MKNIYIGLLESMYEEIILDEDNKDEIIQAYAQRLLDATDDACFYCDEEDESDMTFID